MEIRCHIRWMIRKEMQEVTTIENESFPNPWKEKDFIDCLRTRNCIGMVAEYDERIVGSMVYELHKARLHILTFAVHPEFRRQGVGRQMVQKMIFKLSAQRRTRIMLEVRETNLPAQLFFRSCGFVAVNAFKDFYNDTPEDAYLMVYRFQQEPQAILIPQNRIKGLVK